MSRIKAVLGVLWWGPKAIAMLYRVVRWVQEMDAAGVRWLSPEFFAEARKAVELRVAAATQGQDKGIRGLFESDNALLRGCGIFLKSDGIAALYAAKDSDKAEERTKLRNKFAAESVRQWNAKMVARNHPGI